MTRTRAARALLALALPALLVPALAGPAAAGDRVTEKSVPSVAQVAKVYRHLAGGKLESERSKRFEAPGRGCDESKFYRVSSGLEATYYPTSPEYMDVDAATPIVIVQAHRLRSAKQAKAAVKAFDRFLLNCRKHVDEDGATVTRLRTGKLGDQRVAMTMRIGSGEGQMGARYVVVRSKRTLSTVMTMSMTGLPSAKKALRLAKIAVKKAR